MSTDTLPMLLRSLGLTTLARDYPEAVTRAETENWGYRRFLSKGLRNDVRRRRESGA